MRMKIPIFFAALILVALCVGSCNKNDNGDTPVPVKQDVTFSFAQNGLKGTMLKALAVKEDARYVVVSIENAAGTTVYNSKELSLYNFSGNFISAPLSLDVSGSPYKLTKFLVLDGSKNVIFATPLEGSALAGFVADPLPISFSVIKDQVATKVVPEVLSTQATPVADFGYAAFDFNVVASPLRFLTGVQVYDAATANWKLSTANISVTGDGVSLYSGTIAAITDTVKVKDGYANYLVSVSKTGYATNDTTLTNAQLKTYLVSPLLFLLQTITTVTDIDGNVYHTVTIGTQTWMVENLKVTKYNDGTNIATSWGTTPSYAWNNNNKYYKDVYGALYNWYAVDQASNGNKNICPIGYHVPTDAEWTVLTTYLGGETIAGGRMKEVGTTHWYTPNIGATNVSGFTALPGGYRIPDGSFSNNSSDGHFWSSTQINSDGAWYRYLLYNDIVCGRFAPGKQYGFSVRCVRD